MEQMEVKSNKKANKDKLQLKINKKIFHLLKTWLSGCGTCSRSYSSQLR